MIGKKLRKRNYYERVIKPAMEMKRSPIFRKWVKEQKVKQNATDREIDRAVRDLFR